MIRYLWAHNCWKASLSYCVLNLYNEKVMTVLKILNTSGFWSALFWSASRVSSRNWLFNCSICYSNVALSLLFSRYSLNALKPLSRQITIESMNLSAFDMSRYRQRYRWMSYFVCNWVDSSVILSLSIISEYFLDSLSKTRYNNRRRVSSL
jgi:hypothetical protein